MCIRDSAGAGRGCGIPDHRVVPGDGRGAGRRRGRPVGGPRCLLYTSDAADDLLCVDLGGRRIIKKKK